MPAKTGIQSLGRVFYTLDSVPSLLLNRNVGTAPTIKNSHGQDGAGFRRGDVKFTHHPAGGALPQLSQK